MYISKCKIIEQEYKENFKFLHFKAKIETRKGMMQQTILETERNNLPEHTSVSEKGKRAKLNEILQITQW